MKHKITAKLLLAEKHTKKVRQQVTSVVKKIVDPIVKAAKKKRIPIGNSLAAKPIVEQILAPAIDPKTKRIALVVKSTKNLSNPNVKITRPKFPDPKEVIKKLINDLKGQLKAFLLAQLKKLKELGKAKLNEAKAKVSAKVDEAKRKAEAAKAEAERQKAEAERKAREEAERKKQEAARKAREEAKKKLPF